MYKRQTYSLAHLETLYNTTEQAVEENEKKLVTFSETEIPSLKAALKELQSQIEFSKVCLLYTSVKRKLPIWRIGSNNKFKPMKPCSPFGMSLTLH